MRPLATADGDDFPRLVDEVVPGMAAQGDDLVVGLEDTVGEPVLADELPDVFDRVEFRRAGRQGQDGDVVRHGQLVGGVPSRLIEHEEGVGSRPHLGCDLIQMPLHGQGVAARQDQGGTDAALGADGAEDVDGLGALVMGSRGACSPLGPPAGDLVFLPDPGLVLQPDLYVGSVRQLGSDRDLFPANVTGLR